MHIQSQSRNHRTDHDKTLPRIHPQYAFKLEMVNTGATSMYRHRIPSEKQNFWLESVISLVAYGFTDTSSETKYIPP